jgi:hypothetical protein
MPAAMCHIPHAHLPAFLRKSENKSGGQIVCNGIAIKKMFEATIT